MDNVTRMTNGTRAIDAIDAFDSIEAIDLLRKLVSIDSVFPNEAKLAYFLADELRRCDFSVEMQEFSRGRYNVLAKRGEFENSGNGRHVLLYGHMDTVPPYGYGHVDRNPFKLEEYDGQDALDGLGGKGNDRYLKRLYGLGAYDMKAGLAAILCAVRAVHKFRQKTSSVQSERPLKVMFVSDEEADSHGCYEAIKSGFLKDVDFALTAEVSDVSEINEQTRTITLGRRGRVQYEIDVPGRSFHAARPEHGISAVTQAAAVAIELDSMNSELPDHPKLGKGNQFVRSFHSESLSLSLPDSAKLLVDRHLVFPETAESCRLDLQRMVDSILVQGNSVQGNAQRCEQKHGRGYGGLQMQGSVPDDLDCVLGEVNRKLDGKCAHVRIKSRDVPYMMPFVTAQDNPHVTMLSRAIKDMIGADAKYNYGRSVADENLIAMQGIPVASFGPIGGGEHSNGEWVSKRSYLELIEVLKAFLS